MLTNAAQLELRKISTALREAEKNGNQQSQIRLYRKLVKLTPGVALAEAQLAHLLFKAGDDAAGAAQAIKTLELTPSLDVDKLLFQHICESPKLLGNLGLAEKWFADFPNIYRFKLLYEILVKLDARDRAEKPLHTLLAQELSITDQAQLLGVLGQVHFSKGEYHDAVGCYQLATQLEPENISHQFNLGMMLEQVGRYSEAVQHYQSVLASDPHHPGTHNNLALVMLRFEQFEEGWKHHEWRWAIPGQKQYLQQFAIPRWEGQPLEGKSLIVWAEQGIGDHIMYASMLDDLRLMGGTIHYEIYARLDSLFERSFSGINFLRGKEEGEEVEDGIKFFKQSWPASDYQIPIASLPGILRNNRDRFPIRNSYLRAEPNEKTEIRSTYEALFPGKRLIGVSWRGGKTILTERQSRRVDFTALKALADLPNIQLIDLQYDSNAKELAAALEAGVNIYHDDSVDARLNIDRQASQIGALDCVVSIDNTTVHLAGALGVPTFALLPLNPNWRWSLKEERSYWYNSVRLFRNRELGNWATVISRVCQALQNESLV